MARHSARAAPCPASPACTRPPQRRCREPRGSRRTPSLERSLGCAAYPLVCDLGPSGSRRDASAAARKDGSYARAKSDVIITTRWVGALVCSGKADGASSGSSPAASLPRWHNRVEVSREEPRARRAGRVLARRRAPPLPRASRPAVLLPPSTQHVVEVLVVPPRRPRGPRALDARGEGVGGAARAAEARPRVGRVVARESARAGRARSVRLAKRVPAADERNRLCVVHGHARKGPSHVGRRTDRVRHLEAGFEAVSGGIRGGVGGAASREGQRVRRGSVSMTAPR